MKVDNLKIKKFINIPKKKDNLNIKIIFKNKILFLPS